MSSIFDIVNSAGVRFVDFAVSMLIQSTVLILILLFTDVLLRKKIRAVFRYWIWMVVLLKLMLPPSLSSPISLGRWFGNKLVYVERTQKIEEPEAKIVSPATGRESSLPRLVDSPVYAPVVSPSMPAQTAKKIAPKPEPTSRPSEWVAPPPAPMTPLSWQGMVFLAWLAIVAAMGLLLLQRAVFVRNLVAQARQADDAMNRTLINCGIHMRVKKKVGLKVSANAISPAACGLFRPVILVPENLAPSLGSRQLHVVLLHELAHIKRGDLWVNLAQTVLQIIYFYNPLLWLANTIIRRAREQAVDETLLVAMGEKAEQYPQVLVDVAKLAFKRPVLSLRLIGVVESEGALADRIKRILNRPIPKTAKLGIFSLLAIVVAAAILLPMAKSDAFGAWFASKTLVKFSSDDKPTGTRQKSGDTTTYSKDYTVRFKEGEKLAVVAELYQVGKPMRNLGYKLFTGSEEPQKLSVILKKTHRNEDETSIVHDLRITLGDQTFLLNDILVNTPEFFNNTQWHFFNGSKIDKRERDGRPYAEFDNLLRFRADRSNQRKPRVPRIWMPTYNNVTWTTRDDEAYFISVNMLALSQLDYLQADVPHYAEKMQLPDGTYITGDSTKDERQAVADNYLFSIQRALMREQMPLPELTAHKYYKVGDPIHVAVDCGFGWEPSLDEIYYDGKTRPIFALIDGREYECSPIIGPFGGFHTVLRLPRPNGLALTPGRHTAAYGWRNLDVSNPDEPDRVVHYDRFVADAIEFEIVEEIPADYYSEIYEEGWEDILRRGIETPFTDDMRKYHISGPLLALQIESLPFDIAFDIYAQAESSEERIYTGRVARKANSGRYMMGCDRNVKEITWDTVGQTRWRLILVPSRKVAKQHPPIRHYYGREFVTDWVTFKRSPRFQQNRRSFERRKNEPQRYGGTIKAGKPVDLDRLSRRWRNDSGEARPLPDGFELGWSDENGGTLRIDPRSEVRMLWFPETNANLVVPTAETRRRLVELPGSRLTEIHPPKGERTLVAVRSSEGKTYFVTVKKVNETWANLSWWRAKEVNEAASGEKFNGIDLRLGGSEPLGLFFSNNTLWFEVKNHSTEIIEFNQEPYAQKGSADAQWGCLEISDMNGEAVEYKWRAEENLWNLKPGENFKNSIVNGRPLRKSGPGTYKARVTLVARGLQSGKTFEVKSNWHSFELTPCGYPPDFVPKTAFDQLREADANRSLLGYGHATKQEVISRYEAIIEQYPNSKYELESHFGIAQAASENRDPSSVTEDDYALSRRHYQAIIKQWPDVVTYHTIHARSQAYFRTAEFKQSRRDLYQWLKSLTTEQKLNSMRHYFIWSFDPSKEDIQRAVNSLDKAIATHLSSLEKNTSKNISLHPGEKTDAQIESNAVSTEVTKKITCRTPAELMDNFLELARVGDPAAGELFTENVAPEVTRLLQWYGGKANCNEMTTEYHQMRAELLAGLTEQRRQFYREARIWPDRGDEATQVGPRAYARLITSKSRGENWLKVLLMREDKDGTWQITGLLNRESGLGSHAEENYLNPWSPAIHPAWGETHEYRISANDLARDCYIDFDSQKLHRLTPGSNLTRETYVRLGIDGKCGSREVADGGGLIGIDLLARDGNFTWDLMTPLNVQLASSLWQDFGRGGGGFVIKTREGNIGVMIVTGDANDYFIRFKMLNPACLGSAGTILKAVQSDPGEAAKYFLTGGLCRHGTLDVSHFAQHPELVEKIMSRRRGFAPVRLDTIYANSNVALAITSKSHEDEYRRFVLYLSKEVDRWLVTDVQIETKQNEGTTLKDFQVKYPDARAVQVNPTTDTTTKRI